MKECTKTFFETLQKFTDDEIVCVDETGFCNINNPFFGYFPKGLSPQSINVRRRERRSLAMAIHPTTGIVSYKLSDEAFNTTSYFSFLEETLYKLPKEVKVILMDNVAFHKSHRVRSLVESFGKNILFIPPYSPRCNPIEEVFAMLKKFFRESLIKNNATFDEHILTSLDTLKTFKDKFPSYYKHTRSCDDNNKDHQEKSQGLFQE